MGSNLVAPTTALLEWFLASRVSIESLGYRGCCITFRNRMAKGWLGYQWIELGVEFRRKFFVNHSKTKKNRQTNDQFSVKMYPCLNP